MISFDVVLLKSIQEHLAVVIVIADASRVSRPRPTMDLIRYEITWKWEIK